MKHLAVCALSVAMFVFAAAAYAENKADPMENVSPGALLRADKFDELEAYYASYFKNYNPKVVNAYEPVWVALNRISYSEDLLPHYNKWVAAKPKSYAALVLRTGFYRQYAWTARGAGFINTVSRQGYDIFTQRLLLADADITSASLLNPSMPFHYYEMLQLDMALQRGSISSFSHLMKARQIDPSFYPVYMVYMFMNRPRWGGSVEIMKKIAQDYADNVPGSLLPLLWTDYHDEMSNALNEGEKWWSKPGNWEQVDAVFKKLIEATPEPKKTGLRCTYVTFASRANKLNVLQEQLELIGPNWRAHTRYDVESELYYIRQAWPKTNWYEWLISRATTELKNEPQNALLYFSRGVAEKFNKQYDAALSDLKSALKLDPDLIDAWQSIAQVCDWTSKTQEAIDAADKYLLYAPSDEIALTIKGSNLQKLGHADAAEKLYRDSLNLHPALMKVARAYGYMLLDNKRYEELVQLVDKAEPFLKPDMDRKTAFVLLNLRAQAKMELNNPEAVEEYGKLLTLEDTEKYAESALGKMNLIGGTWEPYKARIKELMDQNCKGKDERDHKLRLNAFNLGAYNWADAVALGESMTKNSPNDPKAQHQLAKAYLTSRRYADALKIYRKLHAENPNDLDAMLGVGRGLLETGDHDGAVKIGMEFHQKYGAKATQEQKALAATIIGHALEAKQKKTGTGPNAVTRKPSGFMSLSSPELRKLLGKTEEALVVAVNNIEANPASLDSYSDFLYFSSFGTKTYVSSRLQIQHVIELAEKRNGPPATPLQTQIFENNKNHVLKQMQRGGYDIAKDPKANLKFYGARYETARTLLKPNAADADPVRAMKEAEEGIRLGGDPVRGQEYMMVAQERLGNLEESRKVAQEILKKDPKNVCARLQIMWLDRVKTPKK